MVEYVFTADTTQPEDTVITARKASTRTLPRTLHTEGFANVSYYLYDFLLPFSQVRLPPSPRRHTARLSTF